MKKLSLILMLMTLSFITIEANATSVTSTNNSNQYIKAIDLEVWDYAVKSLVPNPIECYLLDNYIKVCFISHPEKPVTLQIKDLHDNIVYQDMTVNGKQDVFYIEISHLQPGSYEFYYSDEKTGVKGKFEIE